MIIELIGVVFAGLLACGITLGAIFWMNLEDKVPIWLWPIIPAFAFGMPLLNVLWVAHLERGRNYSVNKITGESR